MIKKIKSSVSSNNMSLYELIVEPELKLWMWYDIKQIEGCADFGKKVTLTISPYGDWSVSSLGPVDDRVMPMIDEFQPFFDNEFDLLQLPYHLPSSFQPVGHFNFTR